MIHTLKTKNWNGPFSKQEQEDAVAALERGAVLYFPSLPFVLESDETILLSAHYSHPKSKNIGYDPKSRKVTGVQGAEEALLSFESMLDRYATNTKILLKAILPHYQKHLERGRTSYRPVEIAGRQSSYRKDDTRLHVDAFPSSPVQGKRILRVFTNINPHDQSRFWRLGEPFSKVVERFLPHCPRPLFGSRWLLERLRITKTQRTSYDHYMLQLHNRMKADETYQKEAEQQEFSFPPQSTWIVYTDLTSHAAMKGQYALEQTYYLPVEGMSSPELAPLKILEKALGQSLL
ncbi:MAG: Kdo hydroxylase family protein [Alphaproteobacteria bacterium]|nr:Kdo hydroxylase family protein [Alphaproteobacteria bacterium]